MSSIGGIGSGADGGCCRGNGVDEVVVCAVLFVTGLLLFAVGLLPFSTIGGGGCGSGGDFGSMIVGFGLDNMDCGAGVVVAGLEEDNDVVARLL